MHFIVSFLILALDLFTKYLVQKHMKPYQTIPVINDIFHITYVQNPGAAFGIFNGKTFFITAISLAVILIIAFVLIKYPIKHNVLKIVLALILGGAIGNLVDRLRYGYVVDFLDFRIWPVFNISDCAIVVGVIILVYLIMFHPDFQKQIK
ncbi:MAG TPA: signal peptidase II [Thermoanaerobacterales bacterium]|uniref:signal peptidase II n=1 Tax=Tepidanaerobacter sp. GT38 TaxID=2722793 RepID=UPI00179445C3|nr:signal peptidase II [Tepidanaerobacter sp. GT38]MCG1012091.1 signal peptidase II [Tepidanaerobacter sp. GT38]HHY43024.1 signal peptidase II [Thermoanaerobacterales bacterium]